jgi:hypothetical protein
MVADLFTLVKVVMHHQHLHQDQEDMLLLVECHLVKNVYILKGVTVNLVILADSNTFLLKRIHHNHHIKAILELKLLV